MEREMSVVESVKSAVSLKNDSMTSVEAARAIAEVQGAIAVAKRFPRDENEAYAKILKSCARKSLAETAIYEYSRAGASINGPSIRLAESIALGWGNLHYGIVELERTDHESVAMAYCLDLESNVKKTLIFSVPHERYSKSKGNTKLTDPRDIYEMIANNGARRMRNCILAIIPGDIVEAATVRCEQTLKDGAKGIALADRIRSMLSSMSEFGVTKEMIEKKFGHNLESISETELARLRKIFTSLKDGMGKVVDFFESAKSPDAPSALNDITQKLGVPDEAPKQTEPNSPASLFKGNPGK